MVLLYCCAPWIRCVEAVPTNTAESIDKADEQRCLETDKQLLLPLLLLIVVPNVCNLITALFIVLLIRKVRQIRQANDEIFKSTLTLMTTALRVTVPKRNVAQIVSAIDVQKTCDESDADSKQNASDSEDDDDFPVPIAEKDKAKETGMENDGTGGNEELLRGPRQVDPSAELMTI